MSELLGNLSLGFGVAFSPFNIALCLIGVLAGTLIGVLRVGPIVAIAVLLPIAHGLPPVGALIMLAGVYYGAQYGGSTTAILANIPGGASSIVTTIDGYQMARQGRAGPALAIAALGSFFAGCVATALAVALAVPLTAIALRFGPADFFSLMVLALVLAAVLTRGSLLKALAMILLGLLLSMLASGIGTGQPPMASGLREVSDGFGFVLVAIGFFGFAEIMRNLEQATARDIVAARPTGLLPSLPDIKASAGPIGRGTVLGAILGILPGGGAVTSAFAAYAFEKRLARDPSRFGRGAIEGVAAPESANNAAAQTSMIPLLTFGIPPNAVVALMLGAMVMHQIVPGPQVMNSRPDLFWGMIAAMLLGNLMLVIINLPLIRLSAALLRVPYRMLFTAILILGCVGVYSLHKSSLDVVMAAALGLFGYFLVKHDFELAPVLLAFVIGPLMDDKMRHAIVFAGGDPWTFFTQPISAVLLLIAIVLLVVAVLPMIRRRHKAVAVGD